MAKQTAEQVITALARLHKITHSDGSVIQAEFARKSGIAQSTISRLLSGADDWQLTRDSQLKLIEAFGISPSEAAGIKPITKASIKTELTPTVRELELIRELRLLSRKDRQEVETLVSIKSTLANNK
jgi:transcriptional regulator with XRE-family HTH domain